MCGFAGEFFLRSPAAELQRVASMAGTLRHRGPDEQGSFISADRRCAIAFHRLAVIDPAGSHQPMTSEDGSVTVACNGEIYNFPQLRRQLAADGVSFRTAGDTEVLLHLYRRHGPGMLRHLHGMFAIALYDSASGSLLLARDRLGQKPLWYATLPGRIVFASQARALLAHPQVSREIDPVALTYYATMGYIPAPMSAWKALRKCLPGHFMTVSTETAQECYWTPCRTDLSGGREDILGRIRHELTHAVEEHMVSDVPIGALLSGGLDSSIVVGLMCKVARAGVRTFTAGFDEAEFDERPAARLVAEHFRTDHTELLVQPVRAAMLDSLTAMYDEPFGDSSALPTWLVCQAAREHVKVALAGDGGDEVFGGYDRYRALRLAETLSPSRYTLVRLAASLARPLASQRERSRLRRFLRFADSLLYPPAVQYFTCRRLFDPADLSRLFGPEFAEGLDLQAPQNWFCDLYEQGEFDDEVVRAQRHDMLTYLSDDLLVKTDIASMACSLELRAPMLDHRLAELGLSLPVDMKVGRRLGKLALREAFKDMLPERTLRQGKRGFGVPLASWLRGELRPVLLETLQDAGLQRRNVFSRQALIGLMNDHFSGRQDHSHRLWALLMLGRWLATQR